MLVWPSGLTASLSVGINGIPRQVTNCDPKMLTVAGGTPRRVASRPKAAIAFGWARKNAGFFHTSVRSSSISSGVGVPFRVLMRWRGTTSCSNPNFG
jgi:hypothetical protein